MHAECAGWETEQGFGDTKNASADCAGADWVESKTLPGGSHHLRSANSKGCGM